MENAIEDKVTRIIYHHLDIEDCDDTICPTSLLINDLGCDSIDLIEIIMDCEREFEIRIEDDEVDNITFGDLCNLIKSKLH